MKNNFCFLACFLFIYTFTFSQERFIQYNSKDKVNDEPKVKGTLGVNMKLNGYYDLFGGLQNSDTFNVGKINVFGTDDSGSLKLDLYQTQIFLESDFITKSGEVINARVEFDFWGGNGKMRLRKAYIQSKHWLIGQTYVPFGDSSLWPNIFEWEGPPSGIWLRKPMIKYTNHFKNLNWHYSIAVNTPISDVDRYGEFTPLLETANQNTPDFTIAFKYEKKWGHLRLSSILRNVQYKYNDEQDNFFGYGFSFSGIHTTQNQNNFQFQLTAGKGISAYNTSVQGFGYDGFPTVNGEVTAMPTYGGWMSYEVFYAPKWHSTFVLGYTRFYSEDTSRYILANDVLNEDIFLNGNVDNWHYYGIANLMFNPIDRLSFGIELDYGQKKLLFDGFLDDEYIDDEKSRDAMRISFGIMYKF